MEGLALCGLRELQTHQLQTHEGLLTPLRHRRNEHLTWAEGAEDVSVAINVGLAKKETGLNALPLAE